MERKPSARRKELRLTKQQELLRQKKYGKPKRRTRSQIPLILFAAALVFLLIYAVREYRKNSFSPDEPLEVHFIDVGQGDCSLIMSGGETMLVDCGEYEYADRVGTYLRSCGVNRLDYIIATHPHSDHMGGMAYIINNFDVGEIIIPHIDESDIPTTQYFEKFLDACSAKSLTPREAEVGEIISIGDARAEVIAPSSKKYDDVNDYSVSFILRHGRSRFLLTGDAEYTSEQEMLSGGRLRRADVYKAGHHGSSSSSCEEFLRVVSPEYAVISCGEENSYGHPHQEVLDRLKNYTDKIYRTDIEGNIIFESDGVDITVRTERGNT